MSAITPNEINCYKTEQFKIGKMKEALSALLREWSGAGKFETSLLWKPKSE
jgi:hypothetical protein